MAVALIDVAVAMDLDKSNEDRKRKATEVDAHEQTPSNATQQAVNETRQHRTNNIHPTNETQQLQLLDQDVFSAAWYESPLTNGNDLDDLSCCSSQATWTSL